MSQSIDSHELESRCQKSARAVWAGATAPRPRPKPCQNSVDLALRTPISPRPPPTFGVSFFTAGVLFPSDGVKLTSDGVFLSSDGVKTPAAGVLFPSDGVKLASDGVFLSADGVKTPSDGVLFTISNRKFSATMCCDKFLSAYWIDGCETFVDSVTLVGEAGDPGLSTLRSKPATEDGLRASQLFGGRSASL